MKLGKNGFTLVEVLVTMSILGIISVISLPLISNISHELNEKKCDTLKEALISSAKLYVDSYKEDLFGNQKSGCAEITYQTLLEKKLMQESDNLDCVNDTTAVMVKKNSDKYDYKIVTAGSTSCDGSLDDAGPLITITGQGGVKKTHTANITISDQSGYNQSLQIKYYWKDRNNNKVAGSEKNYNFENAFQEDENPKLTASVSSPNNLSGEYYLVVVPVNVADSLGNMTVNNVTSQKFEFDNTPPNVSLSISSRIGGYNAREAKVTVTGTDNYGVASVCFTTKNNASSCSWKNGANFTGNYDFASRTGSGTRYTLYAFAKDQVGNISTVKQQSYTIYKDCTSSKYLDCSEGYDESSRPCTVAWGRGWGKKGKHCSNKDSITHVICEYVLRTCPCNQQCHYGGVVYPHEAVGDCSKPYCNNGVYCGGGCNPPEFYYQ